MKTSLLINEEALKLLNTSDFVNQWNQLAFETKGFTHLQEINFVLSWYNIYGSEYDPVIAVQIDSDKNLLAIMCLALLKKKNILTHAGHNNAEYHGWLARPGLGTDFLTEVILLVKEKLNLKKWSWRWVAPGLSLSTFNDLKLKDVYVGLEQRASLIWNLKDKEKLLKLKKSRSLKSKFNKLKRRGKLEFRVITDEQETIDLLNIGKYQSDFRQEAINNSRPFYDNPNKIEFSVARQKLNIVHVSGIWLDNRLLAFHLGIKDGKRVCLGTSSYDPSESKYSPGTLLMIKLAESLTENGYEIFDLTPGTDSYKERFANSKQDLFRPTLYFSPISKVVGRTKHFLLEIGLRLFEFLEFKNSNLFVWFHRLKEFLENVKSLGLIDIVKIIIQGSFSINQLHIYRFLSPENKDKALQDSNINIQNYQDLLLYDKASPWFNRRALLKDAIYKFSKGETLFSIIHQNKLHWFSWCTDANKSHKINGFPCNFITETTEPVLYDIFYEEEIDSESLNRYLLDTCLELMHDNNSGVTIVLNKILQNSELHKNSMTFKYSRKLICIKLFGFLKLTRTKVYT